MISRKNVEHLEKISGQVEGLHKEVTALARKSPNDALNKFKLKFVNATLAEANALLGGEYKPFKEFTEFNEDDVPSNSDVGFMLGQYMEELERKRADNIKRDGGLWIFVTEGDERIRTAPPKKINEKK